MPDCKVPATPDSAPSPNEEKLGFAHENLEGWIPSMATEAEIRTAFEKAFDYRGDLTITLKNGEKVEGYIFDRYNDPDVDGDAPTAPSRPHVPLVQIGHAQDA